jgi:hypothetical protein
MPTDETQDTTNHTPQAPSNAPVVLTDGLVRDVAHAADASVVTTLKVILNLPIRGRVKARVEREIARRGLTIEVRAHASARQTNAA